MRAIDADTVVAIAASGFEVWRNKDERWRSYAYFTDGTRVGYAQRGTFDDLELSTVHIPSHAVGSGFKMDTIDTVTRETLEPALAHAPQWAMSSDRLAVKKWPSFAAFNKDERYVRTA